MNATANSVRAARMARIFHRRLGEAIGEANLREAIRVNGENEGAGWCASHNYCDANTVMDAAFSEVMAREFEFGSDDDASLWGEAWQWWRDRGATWDVNGLGGAR